MHYLLLKISWTIFLVFCYYPNGYKYNKIECNQLKNLAYWPSSKNMLYLICFRYNGHGLRTCFTGTTTISTKMSEKLQNRQHRNQILTEVKHSKDRTDQTINTGTSHNRTTLQIYIGEHCIGVVQHLNKIIVPLTYPCQAIT